MTLLKQVILQVLRKKKEICASLLTSGEGEVSVVPWSVKNSILEREGGKAVFFIKNAIYRNLLLITIHMESHTAILTIRK